MGEDADQAEISRKANRIKLYKSLAFTLGALITLLGALTLSLVIYTWDRGEIAGGVVLEIPLGKLRLEKARSKLEQKRKEIIDRPIHFTTEGKNYSISMKDLGLTYTYEVALQQAYLIGRKGTILQKAISKLRASWGITIKPEYQWNDLLLAEALDKSLAPLNTSAEDARFIVKSDGTMKTIAEKKGKQVDIPSLIMSVKNSPLHQTQSISIPIPINEVSPSVTKSELEKLKMMGLRSSYTTHFDPNQKERTNNIKLAAQAIDGTVLKPNEVFSFNQTVGPRTAEAGYQVAMIIEGHEFVPGLGGGICQVSSTLYNAVQLASLSVSERSRHSLAVAYVPPDQDATVAYPSLDFKFINNSGGYLLIRSIIRDDTLTFNLYGNQTNSLNS